MNDITLKIFKRNLALYGSDFHLWQGFDRQALRDFMHADEKALALYLDAQNLDVQLDDFTVPDLNIDVVAAARAQIIRETEHSAASNGAEGAGATHSGVMGTVLGLWGRVLKPAYALASIAAVLAVAVVLAQYNFVVDDSSSADTQNTASDIRAVNVAQLDVVLDEIETLAVQSHTRQELILAFAEIEKEQDINKFMDYIILEFDDVLIEDALQYLNQEG